MDNHSSFLQKKENKIKKILWGGWGGEEMKATFIQKI